MSSSQSPADDQIVSRPVGCQTYTWQMLGHAWDGDLDAVLDAVAAAGYDGIEVTNRTIGRYADHASAFAAALASRGLRFPAYACSTESGWTDPRLLERDLESVDGWCRFLGSFPGTLLALGGAAVTLPDDEDGAFVRACRLYNQAGAAALRHGVAAVIHPSSHHGSILRTADDYHRLLDALDPAVVNFGPDAGHMYRGGMDVVSELRRVLPRCRQVHLKDVHEDGRWAPFGRGAVDLRGILRLLDDASFAGWITLEEEADEARADPAAAVTAARQVLGNLLR